MRTVLMLVGVLSYGVSSLDAGDRVSWYGSNHHPRVGPSHLDGGWHRGYGSSGWGPGGWGSGGWGYPGGYGGFSISGPGGSFSMYNGPVWAGPVVPYGASVPAALIGNCYGCYPAWGLGFTPAYPVYVPSQDFGFGPNPPALLPLISGRLADRLRNLGQAELENARDLPGAENRPGPGFGELAPPAQPAQDSPPLFLKKSNIEQIRKSLRAQHQGDEFVRRTEFLSATGKYRQAAQSAADLPEPRIRLGLALASLGEFASAVASLKRGAVLDPDWPMHGPSLDEFFGPENALAKNTALQRVIAWTRQDIRDPDRLFLLGVFLYFNEDLAQARRVFQTAVELTSGDTPAQIFLAANRPEAIERNPQPIPPPPLPAEDLGPPPKNIRTPIVPHQPNAPRRLDAPIPRPQEDPAAEVGPDERSPAPTRKEAPGKEADRAEAGTPSRPKNRPKLTPPA